MAPAEAAKHATERALNVATKNLPPEDFFAFLEVLLCHQVIDYVTWRRYRFAGWSVEAILREVRKPSEKPT